MPLLITPPQPLQTTALLPVPAVYAIINAVAYARTDKLISFTVGYYANEAASTALNAAALDINALPTGFTQAASPQEANAVPIFAFLEQVLTAQLTALLPAGTAFANVA